MAHDFLNASGVVELLMSGTEVNVISTCIVGVSRKLDGNVCELVVVPPP